MSYTTVPLGTFLLILRICPPRHDCRMSMSAYETVQRQVVFHGSLSCRAYSTMVHSVAGYRVGAGGPTANAERSGERRGTVRVAAGDNASEETRLELREWATGAPACSAARRGARRQAHGQQAHGHALGDAGTRAGSGARGHATGGR